MQIIKIALSLLTIIAFSRVSAQKETITYELNGRNITDTSKNPFAKFIGEWTLKNDKWTHNWGDKTETIQIPNHHTVSKQINTDNTLFSIIDGPEPNGHIFWSYNPNTKQVNHLSSFGSVRAGVGHGTVNDQGDLELKLTFEGEPEGTYRIYNYTWLNNNEYHMKSVQYDRNDKPTGLFYEGNFIRIESLKAHQASNEIANILNVLDNNKLSIDEQLEVYADDIIHMAPNNKIINNKDSLKYYLMKQREYGHSDMNHEISEIEDFGDIVLMRGAVNGTFYPENGSEPFQFKTKNLFVFKRINGALRISKVIYNMSPTK